MVSEREEVKFMADLKIQNHEGDDAEEMMSDSTLARLIEYLRSIGWSEKQIVDLLAFIAAGK